MAKFIFETMQSSSATYDGPSGTRYTFYESAPTVVTNKDDIEFFRGNYRFKEQGILSGAGKPKPDIDEVFRRELNEIEGLSIETIEILVETYLSKKNMEDELIEGNKLPEAVSDKEQDIIAKYLDKKAEKPKAPAKKVEKKVIKKSTDKKKSKKGDKK